jgi:hypothetical protein
MFSALFSSSRKEEDARQTETVQELYAGLSRLEDRLEVLETLILEPDPKENKR